MQPRAPNISIRKKNQLSVCFPLRRNQRKLEVKGNRTDLKSQEDTSGIVEFAQLCLHRKKLVFYEKFTLSKSCFEVYPEGSFYSIYMNCHPRLIVHYLEKKIPSNFQINFKGQSHFFMSCTYG